MRSLVRRLDLWDSLSQSKVNSLFGLSCDWSARRRSVPSRARAWHRTRERVWIQSPFMRESFGIAPSTSAAPTM